MGNEEGDKEEQDGQRQEAEVIGHRKARQAGNALAAFEVHIKRIVMSQYSTQEGPGLEQIYQIRIGFSENGSHDQHGNDALEGIGQKYDHARLCSQHPDGIGGAGVAAAVLTDVDALSHFSVEIG